MPPSKSVEDLKKAIISGIRDEWDIPELKESEVNFISTLTHGWRSHVMLVSKGPVSDQNTVVVKTFNTETVTEALNSSERKEKLLQYYNREASVLRRIGTHENIAHVLGIMESFRGSPLPALVLPYYPKRDLRDLVERNPELPLKSRLGLMRDVIRGLDYLHSLTPRVVHRDIKGSNILIRDTDGTMRACISDFGSAKFLDQIRTDIPYTTSMASLHWTAPEYLKGDRIDYSNPTSYGDIWSFGCTFLEILQEADPWPVDIPIKKFLKERKHPPRPNGVDISEAIWSLLELCWLDDPLDRINAASISICMNALLV